MRRRPSSPSNADSMPTKELEVKAQSDKSVAKDGNISTAAVQKALAQVRTQEQNPWRMSLLTLATSLGAIVLLATILYSFLNLQQEPKGCQMSYMRPIFKRFDDFDTEHTRFASKYSLYLYREYGIDEDVAVKGIPVVFIPGNAGSYKQVRPIAAEAAGHYDELRKNAEDNSPIQDGKLPLDVFSIDFNEDFTAFHGQSLLDQAEYLNEAIAFILALYHSPGRFAKDPNLPDPRSVIIIGHSMGGMVARTMLTMPNYRPDTINTIITLSAPHSRAPVSFDETMISTYQRVNDFWRRAHREEKGALSDVTIVSIAGGGLDTMIPSEYTSLNSIVPASHGFTVFTSGIPNVWTSMDHLAIMWCDQLRKAVVQSIFDIVDAKRRTQTIARRERMECLEKRLLTGLEKSKSANLKSVDTLLTVDEDLLNTTARRLVLNDLSMLIDGPAQLLAVPSSGALTVLSNVPLAARLTEVLICSRPLWNQPVDVHQAFNLHTTGSAVQLACKSISEEAILLPSSTRTSHNAFDQATPFSYIQIDRVSAEYVVIHQQHQWPFPGWLIAEFSDQTVQIDKGHQELIFGGLQVELSTDRSMMTEVKIPEVHSTLFAYNLQVQRLPCNNAEELFTPLVRQHIADPYESKYFVNTQGGNINVHGVSPYMPPRLSGERSDGLSIQVWSNPSCNTTMQIALKLDILGSAGKIVMRYRTILAVLPILVVLIVIRKQFKVYDATGLFISFSESMDQCIRTSIPFVFLALTFLAVSLSKAQGEARFGKTYDLMLGTQDPFLWFLVPLFGVISVGISITANYIVITLMYIIQVACCYMAGFFSFASNPGSAISYQRVITTAVLLLLVSTLIPYQFAYVVLTLVQFATGVRALSAARKTQTASAYNFYNYVHSFLLLMLWLLPINIPVLIVWIHNLAVHWMTPFSTHHNLLAILPLVIGVEVMSTVQMLPRITGAGRHVTNMITFMFALFAAVYGNSYAYRLHHLLNALATWLLVIYATNLELGGTVASAQQEKKK